MTEAVTIVTGSRKGIGRALAERYAALGHRVIGCSREEPEGAVPFEHITADVREEAAVVRLFAEVRRRHGRVDHLLNCAGVASMNHSLMTPAAALRTLFETNVYGTFLCSREAAKLMQTRKFGRIVNFSSVAVPLKLEGEAAYAASKAAVETLTQVMAREVASLGITVNAVGPTAVDTDLIRGVPQQRIDALLQRQAIHRQASMDDVGAVVDFLLAADAALVTGQILYLGGP